MNHPLRDPPRWKDESAQADVAERTAGRAIRCACDVPPPPAPSLARVVVRVRSARTPRRLGWMLAPVAFVLGLATMASAAHLHLLPTWLTRLVRPSAVEPARENARSVRAKLRADGPPSSMHALPSSPGQAIPRVEPTTTAIDVASTAPPPTALPDLASPGVARPPSPPRNAAPLELDPRTPRPARPRLSSIAQPSAPRPAPEVAGSASHPEAQGAEGASSAASLGPAPTVEPPAVPSLHPSGASVAPGPAPTPVPSAMLPHQAPAQPGVARHLTEAIRLLRAEHSPRAALQLLADHDGELTKAGFEHEAMLLRVEALLALGRRGEVLRLLDGASLTDVAASRTLLVTRGQLRAAANRCSEGLGDFDLVLARSKQVDRQALIGRALCRKQLGDFAGMRADVQRMHDEFPNDVLPDELEK